MVTVVGRAGAKAEAGGLLQGRKVGGACLYLPDIFY